MIYNDFKNGLKIIGRSHSSIYGLIGVLNKHSHRDLYDINIINNDKNEPFLILNVNPHTDGHLFNILGEENPYTECVKKHNINLWGNNKCAHDFIKRLNELTEDEYGEYNVEKIKNRISSIFNDFCLNLDKCNSVIDKKYVGKLILNDFKLRILNSNVLRDAPFWCTSYLFNILKAKYFKWMYNTKKSKNNRR